MREPSNDTLPYATPESLPQAIRADLSPEMLQLYFDAFTGAWQRYADFADRGGVLSSPGPIRGPNHQRFRIGAPPKAPCLPAA